VILSSWSSVCRHNSFCAVTFVLVDWSFWNEHNDSWYEIFGLIWGIVALPVSKQEVSSIKKGVFWGFFVCGVFIVYICFSKMNSLSKIPFRVSSISYRFWDKTKTESLACLYGDIINLYCTINCSYYPTWTTKVTAINSICYYSKWAPVVRLCWKVPKSVNFQNLNVFNFLPVLMQFFAL
jgi:hypothetical protein